MIEQGNYAHLQLIGELGRDEIRKGNRFLCHAVFVSAAGEVGRYVFLPEPSPEHVPVFNKNELLLSLRPVLEFPVGSASHV